MANNRRRNTALPLERGLGILEELSTAGRPLGITDLSRRFGLSKGSVGRFVTLGIPVPTSLMTPGHCEEFARLVKEGAREVSLAMGCRFDGEVQTESAKPPVLKTTAATTGARSQRTRVPISN